MDSTFKKELLQMKKSIFIGFLLTCLAASVAGQTPQKDSKNEFFAGYSFHSADINTLTIDPHRTEQQGVNVEYVRNLNRRLGVVGDISAHFKRSSRPITGGTFESRRDQYYLLGGLQFKAPNKSSITPFVHALAGASLFRGFTTNRTAAGNVFTFDDATSFALALGGGLDVRVNDRIAIRMFQADYVPTFFGPGRQDNIRLSVGIIFKH
jgi:opacity protein-like surface antigen